MIGKENFGHITSLRSTLLRAHNPFNQEEIIFDNIVPISTQTSWHFLTREDNSPGQEETILIRTNWYSYSLEQGQTTAVGRKWSSEKSFAEDVLSDLPC